MKFPQYFDIDGVYVKVDEKSGEIFVENVEGNEWPSKNTMVEGRPLPEEAFKRVRKIALNQHSPFKYYKKKYGAIVPSDSPYEQDLDGLLERNVRQINAGEEFTIVTETGVELFNSRTVYESAAAKAGYLLALVYHRDQLRKGDKHPFLEHPLEVAHVLWQHRFSANIIAAGYCHDLLEDTDCTSDTITLACSADVTRIVEAVSNDENLSDHKDWEEKKLKYIESVKLGGPDAIAVSIADKIVNMKSLLAEYEIEGSAVWQHFNRGKDKKVWYEQRVMQMAQENWSHPLLDEYEQLVERMKQLES